MTSEDVGASVGGTYEVAFGETTPNQRSFNSDILETERDINPYDNKNRHNKNVVIWKDGYIVPLHMVSVRLEDLHIDDIFQSPPKMLSSDRSSGRSICFLDDIEDSVFPDERRPVQSIAQSHSDPQCNACRKYTEQEPSYSPANLPTCFTEDIGSRISADFTCRRDNCECPYASSLTVSTLPLFCQQNSGNVDTVSDDEYKQPDHRELAATGECIPRDHETTEHDGEYSERSSYSTDPADVENGYEIIDWDSDREQGDCCNFVDAQRQETNDSVGASNAVTTNPSDAGNSDEPQNSPPEASGYTVVEKSDVSLQRCVTSSDVMLNERVDTAQDIQYSDAGCLSNGKSRGRSNNAVHVTGVTDEQVRSNTIQETAIKHDGASKISKHRTHGNFTRRRHSYSQSRQSTYAAENPTLIDARSIQYEADPKTGKVLTVGKGSFGQVFKARFFDTRFRHLRIVVKEFDEEFTNKHEIIAEAQKLLFLRDTGYVPMCYGLVNLGAQSDPRYGIVQEYIGSGLTLEQLLWDQYDLPMEMWLSIALQCCEGLDRFHNKRILLNDIKSNNIILEFSQESVNIKYIDFGLATDMRGKRYKNTKSLEDFVYLAPEVRIHGHVTTVATDVYSLGYMLEQINGSACIPELRFVAGLCMKPVPAERTLVSVAASFIGNYMNRVGCDTQFSQGFDYICSTGFW